LNGGREEELVRELFDDRPTAVILNAIEDIVTRANLAEPRYPADACIGCRTVAVRECVLAKVLARTTAYPWRAPRCGGASEVLSPAAGRKTNLKFRTRFRAAVAERIANYHYCGSQL
jgi:hypothetical protein